jgi:hypothetical protein
VNTHALACILGALVAAPLAASAATQPDIPARDTGTFLIVDSQSGRTLATLVPVDGTTREFRLLGTVTARGGAFVEIQPQRIPSPLTPGQIERARLAVQNEQFYAAPDAGSRGW